MILPLSAGATTIFTDGLNAATNVGLAVTTTVGNFNVVSPTNVDLLGGGTFGFLCTPTTSQCVDLNGSGANSSGIIQSNILFAPGTYLLSFDLTGSGRGNTTSTLVTFGNFSQTFTLASGDLTTGNIVNQLVTLTSSGFLTFTDENGNGSNVGSILDTASVSTNASPIPEPSSLILLGSGMLTSLGFVARRRKQTIG
ncbi:MAG: PEP-CTERM sorting domain-containing protein [Acidobacteriota bacterium]|nr:PEP-CTERM sorting domain-containing protein [Acidobacteriota bacterium]